MTAPPTFLLALLFLGGSQEGGAPLSAPQALESAAQHYQQRAAPKARAILRSWCLEAPRDGGRWLLAARLMAAQRDFAEGKAFAAASARLLPDNVEAASLLGTFLLLSKQVAQAEEHFAATLRKFPENPDLHFQYAMASSMNQKLLQAAESFERSLALQADQPIVHFWAGETFIRLSQYSRAEHHLAEAMKAPRENPDAAWKLASVLGLQSKDQEAERLFRLALKEGSTRSRQRAAFHYGVYLYERRRDAEGAGQLQEVTRDWPEHRMAWSYLARCQRRLGQQEKAQESLRRYQALQRHEDSMETEALLAQMDLSQRPR